MKIKEKLTLVKTGYGVSIFLFLQFSAEFGAYLTDGSITTYQGVTIEGKDCIVSIICSGIFFIICALFSTVMAVNLKRKDSTNFFSNKVAKQYEQEDVNKVPNDSMNSLGSDFLFDIKSYGIPLLLAVLAYLLFFGYAKYF